MRESFIACLAVGLLGCSVVSAVGCGRNAASADEAVTPVHAAAAKRLAAARTALAMGQDTSMKCKSAFASLAPLHASDDASAKRLVADIERTCGYDAPLAWAQQNLDAMANGSNAPACLHVDDALGDLRRFGHSDEAPVRAIDAAFRKTCS
jgi:hypothetical protein